MATVSDITYGNFTPALYTPDYSFLRYALDKKSSQYEQGLQSVSSSYNVLKKNLTDPINAQRRDEYLKSANAQLQKMASSDLSLQENVNSANSIFQPMATDAAFLYDSSHTENNQRQLAKMKSWAESDDPETRKKFNQDIYNYVAGDLDSLKTANGDMSKYKVEGRSAFAYQDPLEKVQKAAKEYGFQFKKDVDGGTYLYSIEGGPEGRVSYMEFAKEILGNDDQYKQQTQILAKQHTSNLLSVAKKQSDNIGLSDEQILGKIGNSTYESLKTKHKTQIDGIKKDVDTSIADADAIITAATANGTINTPEVQQMINQKYAEAANKNKQYTSNLSYYTDRYGDDKTSKDKKAQYIKDFSTDPTSIFYNLYSMDDINRFANVRSLIGSTGIKKNEAYFEGFRINNEAQRIQENILNGIHDNSVQDRAENRQEQHEDWLESGKPTNGSNGVGSGGTGSGNGGSTKGPEIRYADQSTVNVTKTEGLTNLKNKLDTHAQNALNYLTTQNGGALSSLLTMGVKRDDISTLREYFINQNTDPNYKGTKEQRDALLNTYTALLSNAKATGDIKFRNELNSLHGKDVSQIDFHTLLDSAFSNYVPKNKDEYDNGYLMWQEHKKEMEQVKKYSTLFLAGRDAVVAGIKKDPAFEGLIVKNADGKDGLYGKEDVIKRLKKYNNITDDEKAEIASEYVNGTLDYTFHRSRIQGKEARETPAYSEITINGKKIKFDEEALFKHEPKEYKKLIDRVNNEIPIPNLPNELASHVESSPMFTIYGETQKNIVNVLTSPTLTNSDIKIYNGPNDNQNVDPKDQVAIRAKLTDKNFVEEGGVKVITQSGATGGLAVQVTVRAARNKDEKESGEYGKTYLFPIDINKTSSDVLKSFHTIQQASVYQSIKESGKTANMFDLTGLGVKVDVHPLMKGADTGEFTVTRQVFDKATNGFKEETFTKKYDLSKYTYEELKDYILKTVVNPSVYQRLDVNAQTAKTNIVTPGNPFTGSADDIKQAMHKKYGF